MEKMQAQSTPQTQRRPSFPKPKMGRKWIKRIIAIIAVAAVAVLVLRGCFGGGGISAVGAYLSDAALYQEMTVYVSGTGTIEPIHSYKVTTLVQGEIMEAPFEEGQTVHKGDLLFRIDSSDVENAVSQAQLALQQAEQNYEQAQQSLLQAELALLQSQQSFQQSQQQVQQAEQTKQQAEQQVQQAEQQVRQAEQAKQQAEQSKQQAEQARQQAEQSQHQAEQAKQQAEYAKQQAEKSQQQAEYAKQQAELSYEQLLKTQTDNQKNLSILATESGVITKLYADPGDDVMAGTLIADILDRDHMKLTVPFHSADAAQFQAGQAAVVTVNGTLETLTGTIDSIAAADSVGAGGALVRNVTILVDNPGALSTSSTGTASVNGAVCAAAAAFAYAASEQVYAKATGELESLLVKEGDRVVKDQVIGMVEEPDMESQIESARLNVENAAVSVDSAALNVENAALSVDSASLGVENAALGVDSASLGVENAALGVDSAALAVDNALLGVDNASLAVDSAALGVDSAVLNSNSVALNVENARLNVESVRLNVENARLNVESARLSLERAQDQLDDYSITSTIDGTVIEKNYEVGDNIDAAAASAAGGSYPAVIYDLSALTFDMTIDERDISSIQVGQIVEITADALDGKSFTGKVDKVNINGTTVNGKTTYPVTVLVDGAPAELYPGMNVSAKIIVEEAGRVLCIPVDYVSRGNVVLVALPGAMDENGNVVDRSKIEEREITLGRSNEEYIEVLDGLEEGDTVLLENNASSAMMAFMGV